MLAQSTTVVSQVPRASSVEILRRDVADAAPDAYPHLGSTASVVLVNGDLVLDPQWVQVVRAALSDEETTLCAQRPDGRGHLFDVLATGAGGHVYAPDPGDSRVEAIGMSILAPGVLTRMAADRAVGVNPWFEVVLPDLARAGAVKVVVRDHPWADLGSWSSLLRWEAVRHGHRHDSPHGCQMGEVGLGSLLNGSVVMTGGRVGAGCWLEGVVVLPGGVVGDGVSLRQAVVGPGAAVSALV